MKAKLLQARQVQDFWHITRPDNADDIKMNGLKRGERGYVWCTTSSDAALEFQEMVGPRYALVQFRWPYEETLGDVDMTGDSMQEVFRMIPADIPPNAIVDIEYGGEEDYNDDE